MNRPIRKFNKGFTLVEVAVVLVIIGLVFAGLLSTLTIQVEKNKINQTLDRIQDAKQALLGYAMANGRFPCPAVSGATGVEAFATAPTVGTAANGLCAQYYTGFVPAITLGITPVDNSGYMLDGWDNPIRYAIFNLSDGTADKSLLTATDGIKNANNNTPTLDADATCNTKSGMPYVGCKSVIYVCDSAPAAGGANAVDCGTASLLTASSSSTSLAPRGGAFIVIYSTGKNGSTEGTGNDEAANPNPNSANDDPVFVSHLPIGTGAVNGEFDDELEWISASEVFIKMVQANQLP